MGDSAELKVEMGQLVELNNTLIDICVKQNPAFIGFKIEQVSKDDEESYIHKGITSLKVDTLDKSHSLHVVLAAWGSYYKADGFSTKYVERLPGLVVINEQQDHVLELVTEINHKKNIVANIVQTGRDQYQRHQFIHDAFEFIMTEQVYRKITIFEDNITNAWFNWTSRPVPKTLSIEEAKSILEKQKNKPKNMLSPTEWTKIVNQCINNISSSQFQSIQQLREFRVLPTVELQSVDIYGQKKRTKRNATTPIILLNQSNNSLPKFSLLNDYIATEQKQRNRFSNNKVLLSNYFNLVGVK